jgi:hypothetical protein
MLKLPDTTVRGSGTIRLKLSVDKSDRLAVGFPVLGDSLSNNIEIVGKSRVDTAKTTAGRVKLSQELLITVFDTGFFEVPPLAFIVHAGLSPDTIKTLPVVFEIVPMKLDSTIRDIRPNYTAPVNFAELWPFLLGAALLGLLIWWLVRYLKRRSAMLPKLNLICLRTA